MALRVYGILRSRGVRVPDDISVAGYDNYRVIAETLYPPLTTVELPYAAMGVRAAERLLAMIAGAGRAPTPSPRSSPAPSTGAARSPSGARTNVHQLKTVREEYDDERSLDRRRPSPSCWAGQAARADRAHLWYHGAGNEVESEILNQIVADFNASQADWKVALESFPQGAYNDAVVAAALAGNLPDILDVDGPIMPNWAWAGYLQPLPHRPDQDRGLPARHQGRLERPALLGRPLGRRGRADHPPVHARRAAASATPTLEEPWTRDEFMAALEAAKASGKYEYAIDLGMSDQGEWYPYAFLPFLRVLRRRPRRPRRPTRPPKAR